MAQNDGSRARPWTGIPIPSGPWAPFVAVAAVLATVAVVAGGARIGGDAPPVPDGRPYATADPAPAAGLDRPEPDDTGSAGDEPPVTDRSPEPESASASRTRRRPAEPHRRRRGPSVRSRARAGSQRDRPRAPIKRSTPARRIPPRDVRQATPVVRRPATPHRAPAISSAEREFGL